MAHPIKPIPNQMESMAERAWKFGLYAEPQRTFSPYAGIIWYEDNSMIFDEAIIVINQRYSGLVR